MISRQAKFLLIIFVGIGSIVILTKSSTRINNFIFSKVLEVYKIKYPATPIRDTQETNSWHDPRNLFPIIAYNFPQKTNDLVASLQILEKGGINIVINTTMGYMPEPFEVQKAISKLKNSNLQLIVILENECKDEYVFKNSNNTTNVDIKKYLERFNDEYIYGWYIWDEPGENRKNCGFLDFVPNDDNEDVNILSSQILKDTTFSRKLAFVNLFPTYWEGTPNLYDYEKYLELFIASQKYKPRLLCFDHYPFRKEEFGGFRSDYFANLEIISKKAKTRNIPFWTIILSSGHGEYKNPTFEEIRFQVFSALAYGAKGIGYYLYSRALEEYGYTSWILEKNVDNIYTADTSYGRNYLPVKKLNEQVQTLGKILNNLESEKVIHTSLYPSNQIGISKSILNNLPENAPIKGIIKNNDLDSDPKILIGVFYEKQSPPNDKKYLMVVNKDVRNQSSITIKFDRQYSVYEFDKNAGGKILKAQNHLIKILMLPGEGVLLSLENYLSLK